MKVDIWSDVMCPFCYIGKRRFEAALKDFPQRDNIEITWHSFQLDPSISAEHGQDLYTYLAERKGQTREWAVQVNAQVTNMAAAEGLQYNLDKAIIANSFDAHRLSHLATTQGLGDACEEALFKAYFTEGKDISNHDTLIAIGTAIGLDAQAVSTMLQSDAYTTDVQQDIHTAQTLGISGVPFFVLDDKYAVSGAQPTETFQQALQTAYQPYQSTPLQNISGGDGNVCTDEGCEV